GIYQIAPQGTVVGWKTNSELSYVVNSRDAQVFFILDLATGQSQQVDRPALGSAHWSNLAWMESSSPDGSIHAGYYSRLIVDSYLDSRLGSPFPEETELVVTAQPVTGFGLYFAKSGETRKVEFFGE